MIRVHLSSRHQSLVRAMLERAEYVRLLVFPPQVESRLRADLGSRDSETATLVALFDLGGRTGR